MMDLSSDIFTGFICPCVKSAINESRLYLLCMDIPIKAVTYPDELEKKSTTNNLTDEDIIRELCTVNGIQYERIQAEGSLLETLEVFFGGFPRFISQLSSFFPNITCLKIVGQDVSSIEHISSFLNLEELWIVQCKVRRISGIKDLKTLRKLYLYENRITKIDGISSLVGLKILWLSDNSITCIQGLEKLRNLQELNLAENKIESIGHALDECSSLQSLELSGNLIKFFKNITALSRLPNLRHLGLNDPRYSPSPISQLCNYITQILYHLPNLERLDGHDVFTKPYKVLAESTVVKKKMFYNMRWKTLQQRAKVFCKKLDEYKDTIVLASVKEQLTRFWLVYKQIELDSYLSLRANNESNENAVDTSEQAKSLEIKVSAAEQRIYELESNYQNILRIAEHYKGMCQQTLSSLSDRLFLELESGGNIKLETGSPDDSWFISCFDLMLSRFCAADYKELGIQGIKIHRITRVYNRILRLRFDDKLVRLKPEVTETEDQSAKTQVIRNKIEYLFWIWDSELLGGTEQATRVLEEGFLDAESSLKLGKHGAVPLANCLSLADQQRIRHLTNAKSHNAVDTCPYRCGQVVISKCYLGRYDQATDFKAIAARNQPSCDAVYRPRKRKPFGDLHGSTTSKIHDLNLSNSTCDCSQSQAEWFIFDNDMAIPEYLVEFEYLTMVKPSDPFVDFDFINMECPSTSKSSIQPDTFISDNDKAILNHPPSKHFHRIPDLSAEHLKSYLGVESIEHVTHLNIHNQKLKSLAGIQHMSNLKTLIASFNDLSRVEELSYMKIEDLNLSFNKIQTLDGMKGMTHLRKLDISWNCMRYIRDEFAILRKHAPLIETLDTNHNLWLKPRDFRLRVIARMKSLQVLDGIEISESEATAALRLAASSRVTQVHVMSHGRTEVNKPRSLSLAATAQILSHNSRYMIDRVHEPSSNTHWMTQITSLCLDGQHLVKLSGIDKLVNLRWASFCHNDLVKIESSIREERRLHQVSRLLIGVLCASLARLDRGLDHCHHLEELYLDDNCIYKLDGLSRLSNLRRLSLSDNYLVYIDPSHIDQLHHLHYLALDHNKISTLSGLQRCKGLIELYISQNRISNIRDVFYLKSCKSLLILDLSGNALCLTEKYRMFMIYHLSMLKAFDGMPVESSELSQARETLGGRLTSDFIAERVGHSVFSEIKELDLPQLSLKSIDLGSGEQFANLRSINLENNNLTSLGDLIHLPCLRVLCLNYNKIECLTPLDGQTSDEYSASNVIPMLESLEVLHLGYNNIKDLTTLHISRLTGLKALFLQGNELQTVSGLDGLHDLRELVLDKNKIKTITESSFINQWNLQELHIEENRLRELSNFHHLESLQRLYLGMNRVQDLVELERLSTLTQLVELSLVSCPVSRRLMHRPLLVYRIPSLLVIDGIPVTEEEQIKASLYYIQQQQQQVLTDTSQALPGIAPAMAAVKGQVPVKVTNVSLGNFIERTPWSGTLQFDPSFVPSTDDRSRKQKNSQVGSTRAGGQSFNIQSTYTGANQTGNNRSHFYGDSNPSNSFNRSNRKL